nr:PAS domain S-box protein [uncultured Lacibacter sp.]
MARQKYDIPVRGTNLFEERFWDSVNIPVFNDAGEISCIIHSVTDVTAEEFALQKASAANAASKESTDLLQHAERISHFGTWEYNLQTNALYWSDGVYAITGFQPADFVLNFETAMSVIHPDDRAYAIAMMEQTIQKGAEYNMQKRFITADGSIRHINSRARLINDAQGQPVKMVGVFHDVTEEVLMLEQLAASEQKLQALVQTLDGIFWEADASTFSFHYISPQVKRMLGYSVEEWLQTPGFWQDHIHPDDKEYAVHYCHRETMAGNNHVFEYRMITANGNVLWLRDIVSVITEGQRPVLLRGLMIDISKEKQQDEELKKSKQAVQKILDQSLDVICTIDKHGYFRIVSEAATQLWGYTPQELVGKQYIDLVFAADKDQTLQAANTIMGGLDMTNFENRYVRKDGHVVPIVWSVRWDAADELMYCIAKDASEKKKAEREMAHLIYNTEESFLLVDKDLRIVSFNNQFFKLYRQLLNKHVKRGDDILDYAQPERREIARSIYERVLKGEEESSTITIPQADGSKTIFSIKYKPAFNEEQETIGAFITARDITEAEMAKEKIEASEKQYKYLFENNPAPMFVWDFGTKRIVDCNEAALLKYNYTREEFLQLTILDIRPEEDIPRIESATLSEDLYNNTGSNLHRNLWRHLTKDGVLMDVEIAGHILEYKGRKSALVIINDVTEQLKAERSIASSEEKYKTLFNSSPTAKWVYELDSYRIQDVNETAIRHYGYSREDFLQMTIFDLLLKEDIPEVMDVHQDVRTREGAISFGIFTHRKKDGSLIRVNVTGYRFRYLDKDCMMVLSNDVTERELLIENLQKREAELTESNLRYGYVTKATNDAVWDWNLETGVIEWGEGFQTYFGYDLKQIGHDEQSWTSHIHPQDRDRIVSSIYNVIEGGNNFWNDEYRYFKADGTLAYVTDRGFIIRNSNGKPLRMVGAMQDVTQKRTEEYQRRLLEAVISKTNDAIIITKAEPLDGPDGPEIVYANDAFVKMTGYGKEEIIGKTPRILQGPGSDMAVLKKLGEDLRQWKYCDVDVLNYSKDGREFWVNLSIAPVADENGWFTHWVSVQKDITERKLDELQRKLLADISLSFNQEKPLKDILPEVMKRMVESDHYGMAETWFLNEDARYIHLFSGYILPEKKELFYDTSSTALSFEKGQGMPGYVWEKDRLHVWKNVDNDPRFVRREAALKAGLKTAAGIPLRSKDQLIGVLLVGLFKEERPGDAQLALLQNVTQHLAEEIRRKQLEESLNQLFNTAPDVISIAGFDGFFKRINPAFCELLEYSEEELLGKPFREFVHTDDRDNTVNEEKQLASGRRTLYFENRYVSKTGKIVWLAWSATPVREEGLIYAIAKDITDKKELQRLLDNASEFARIGGWEVDVVNDVHSWSKMTKEIHEVDEHFIPDMRSAIAFYREDVRELVQQYVGDAITKGEAFDFELPIITAKGNERWVRAIGQAEFRDGICVKIFGSFQDVHQRKTAELELQLLFEERNNILESIGDAFFAVDRNWVVSYWNKEAEALLATKREAIVGKNLWDVFAGAKKLASFTQYHRAMETGTTISFEDYYAPVNRWFEISAYPSAKGLSVYFKDVSIRKHAETEIRRSNERFEKVTEATNDAVWDYDVLNDVLFWGKGFNTLFGYNPETTDVSFSFLLSCIHTDDALRIAGKIQEYMMDPNSYNWFEEYRFKKADGNYAYVIDRAVFIRNDQGIVTRVVGAMTDISYRKEHEESLRKLNAVLDERAKQLAVSNRELEQFAYIASHDLQEPLRMVTGFLTQIEKKYNHVLDEKGKQYIHFAVDGARRMRQIILDLLEFSRVGRVSFHPEEINLNELIAEIRLLLSSKIEEKQAQLVAEQLPVLRGHRSPLRQVFQNLISNALKYSRSNVAPVVELAVQEQADSWQFSVKDNGIGIEKEYYEKIFIIFQRLHNKDDYAGTGMGLAISKKIVENLGGRIWLESTPGEGSTFYFTLAK